MEYIDSGSDYEETLEGNDHTAWPLMAVSQGMALVILADGSQNPIGEVTESAANVLVVDVPA